MIISSVPKESVPSWLKWAKSAADSVKNEAVKAMEDGPVVLVEDIGQGLMDEAETPEGIASIAGSVVGSIAGGYVGKLIKAGISVPKVEATVERACGAESPSEIAKSWQGYGKYPDVDTYKNITLKKGKVIYRGEPNGTEYFTTKSAIERSGNGATNVFEGLQVEKNPIHGYRGTMQGYKTTTSIDAAFGVTKANPQFGKGGLPQIFVPNAEELVKQGVLLPVDSIPLTK